MRDYLTGKSPCWLVITEHFITTDFPVETYSEGVMRVYRHDSVKE